MAVSLDAAGWTNVTPSSDTRTVYVSSSTGSDSNSGLSASSPVKTIAKGYTLIRSESPDWMLLKKGDTFFESIPTWKKSGKSAQEPMLISSYGSGDRPYLKTGAGRGFYSYTAFHDLAMIGLNFEANTRNPDSNDFTGTTGSYGFQTVGPINGLLVEDCSFDHYVYNMSIQGFSGDAKNISIRRSEITNAYAINDKTVGLYASRIDGLLLEGNLIDHNGWNEELPGGEGRIGHNVYFWQDTKNAVVRGNIISDGGSHGLQARGGGVIENNLFLRNPIALLVGNGSEVTPGGVAAKISGNVFLNSRDIGGQTRGWAIEVGNLKAGAGSYIRDNVIADDNENAFPAIRLYDALDATNASAGVGINDLTIERNIIYNWYKGLSVDSNFVLGGSGARGLNNLVVRNNDFQMTTNAKIITQPQAYNAAEESFSNNRYFNYFASSGWFSYKNATTSFASWKSLVEPTAQNIQAAYPAADRDIEGYNQSIGGSASRTAFLSAAANQSKDSWRNNLTAAAVISWVRAGFTGAVPSEVNDSPDAALTVSPITAASAAPQILTIKYTDDDAVDASTIGAGDLTITGPNGFTAAATFVSINSSADGSPRTATYNVAAPGGAWESGDNGTYTVKLNANAVQDTDGDVASAATLGSFTVNIADEETPSEPTTPPTTPTPTADAPIAMWSVYDPTLNQIRIRFDQDVSASLSATDMRMQNMGTLAMVSLKTMTMSYDKSNNIATFDLPQMAVADYKVMLSSGAVLNLDGDFLDGNDDGTGAGVHADDYVMTIEANDLSALVEIAMAPLGL